MNVPIGVGGVASQLASLQSCRDDVLGDVSKGNLPLIEELTSRHCWNSGKRSPYEAAAPPRYTKSRRMIHDTLPCDSFGRRRIMVET